MPKAKKAEEPEITAEDVIAEVLALHDPIQSVLADVPDIPRAGLLNVLSGIQNLMDGIQTFESLKRVERDRGMADG